MPHAGKTHTTDHFRAPPAARPAGAATLVDRSARGEQLRSLRHLSIQGAAAIAQGAQLTQMFGALAAPPVQLVKTANKTGIKYAESEAEARRLMTDYAKKNDIAVSATILQTAIELAMRKDLGIDEGERTILLVRQEADEAERRQKRKDDYEPHYLHLLNLLSDDLAESALKAAFARFVANPFDRWMTLGPDATQDEVDDAMSEWKRLKGKRAGCDFWGFNRQDKAAKGKGNVGDTLDTRTVQANFMCSFGGHEINVHVNISD